MEAVNNIQCCTIQNMLRYPKLDFSDQTQIGIKIQILAKVSFVNLKTPSATNQRWIPQNGRAE